MIITLSFGEKNKMKKIGIIILNYNNADATIKCVKNISTINYNAYFLIVVDNHSTDNSYDVLRKNLSSDIYLIETNMNGGYAYGNNIGISQALKRDCEYILILNNDVVLENNSLEELVTYADRHSNVGIIGPAILEFNSSDDIIQSTGATNNLISGKSELINNGKSISNLNKSILYPDYLGGACLLVRRDAINKAGFIPENYFLFYEENEWCLKIRNVGYEVVCNPKARVYHVGSESINKIGGLSYYFMIRNVMIFEKRNATKSQFIVFFMYTLFRTVLRSLKRPKHWKDLLYYFDGLVDRNKYEYLKEN